MKEKKTSKKSSPGDLLSGDVPQQSSKEAKVPYTSLPIPLPPGKKIHPRQIIPPLPEGKDVPDENSSSAVDPD